MFFFRLGALFLFASLSYNFIAAQGSNTSQPSATLEKKIAFMQYLHDSISSPDRRLVNGEEYFIHQQNAKNHPFYRSEGWMKGSVTIRGNHYSDRLLKYDIFLDQPLLLYIESGARTIAMRNDFIDGFMVEGDRFVKLNPGEASDGNVPGGGFYQLVYEEGLSMYVKWSKNRIRNEGFQPDEFRLDRKIVILKDGVFHLVKNDRQLRKLLDEHKKSLRKFMQAENIHLSTSTPERIALVLAHYEKLMTE